MSYVWTTIMSTQLCHVYLLTYWTSVLSLCGEYARFSIDYQCSWTAMTATGTSSSWRTLVHREYFCHYSDHGISRKQCYIAYGGYCCWPSLVLYYTLSHNLELAGQDTTFSCRISQDSVQLVTLQLLSYMFNHPFKIHCDIPPLSYRGKLCEQSVPFPWYVDRADPWNELTYIGVFNFDVNIVTIHKGTLVSVQNWFREW